MDWLLKYGPDRIILGADFRDGIIAISGWEEETELGFNGVSCLPIWMRESEKPYVPILPWMECLKVLRSRPITKIKGEMEALHLIASGGIGEMDQIEKLDEAGIDGVIVGKAIYENRIPLKVLENYILNNS